MATPLIFCATCGAQNPQGAATCSACGNPPLVAAAPQRVLLNQRYHLLRLIAEGGFGAVYRAEDTQLGNRLVAVKKMLQDGLKTEQQKKDAAEGFQREANMLAGLGHPNLPRIFEQFEEGGNWYLVMEFIEGETLETHLNKAPGGRLLLEETLHIGLQLTKVLSYLHTHQPPIIFRDLKPSNIMLTTEGHVYLIDFGIARLFKPGQGQDTVIAYTDGYAAPEQYGRMARTTPQSDIYSLGATLHQMLSGADPSNTPFFFKPLHLAASPELEALIMQMLKQDKSERPADMQTVRQELQRIADELSPGSKRASASIISSLAPQATAAPKPPQAAPVAAATPKPASPVTPVAAVSQPKPVVSLPPAAPRQPASSGISAGKPAQKKPLPRKVIVGLVIAIVLVAGVLIYSNSFHQTITTTGPITGIQVGTDFQNGMVTGVSDTFHVGDTVYVAVTVDDSALSVDFTLTHNNQLVTTTSSTYYSPPGISEIVYNSATVTSIGVYKWDASTGLEPGSASITFNVIK